MDLLLSLFDNIAVLIWHISIGLIFAICILAINHFIPYQFQNNPKDVVLRKIIFYVSIFIVFAFSWLFDLFYLNTSIVDSSGADGVNEDTLEELLKALIPLNAIISTISFIGVYYGVAFYMKTQLKFFKCYSVFKFK